MCPGDLPAKVTETNAKAQTGIDGLQEKLGVLSEDNGLLVPSYRFMVSTVFSNLAKHFTHSLHS